MKKCVLLVFLTFFIFSACDANINDPYTGYDDYIDKSDQDYQERPDSENNQGQGSTDKDGSAVDDQENDNQTDSPDDNLNDEDIVEEGIYSQDPEIQSCEAGVVSYSEKKKVLTWVNYIRSLHNLSPVTYKDDDDIFTSQCSLVIAANNKLDHHPDSSWDCYTEDALTGCSKSNIYIYSGMNPLDVNSEKIINAYMTDIGVDSLGHRRWLIDPWLDHISFARADDVKNKILGSAIKVINDEQQDISGSEIKFVAYPYEEYPRGFFNKDVQMSFSVIENTTSKWHNDDVDFKSAAILITDPENNKIQISGRAFDNDGYGVPNILRWKVGEVKEGVRYEVVISGVRVSNVPKDYSYWFELK